MRNTTQQGNKFRDQVAQLLELTPHIRNINIEHPLGSQDVDIYYVESTSVGTLRVACECKDYSSPLTKSFISKEIYPKYNPLLDGQMKYVDAVRIIAPLPIGTNAQRYVDDCGFTFITREQLESSLIDFRSYMHSLCALFKEDGLDKYYIRPVLSNKDDLEESILNSLSGDSSQPIAILSGYG